MTENQPFVPFRNEHILLTNSCDSCARQDVAFDLKKYSPYLDKIRALFVPSLEYRIHSFLKEFVYYADSRWAKQCPCFKQLVNTIVAWKDLLSQVAEYDIGAMEEMIRKTVKCMVKDELATCFLNSILPQCRLNKICRELDALEIEDNILRRLNVWNFINERDFWLHRDCFTNPDTATDCNMRISSLATPCDAKGSTGGEKAAEPLATSDVYRDGSTGHTRSMTSQYRAWKHPQVFGLNKNFASQQKDDNSNRSARAITGLRNSCNGIVNIRRSFKIGKSRDIEPEKVRNNSRLKMIVRRMYLENCGCPALSRPIVARPLSLPCKPSDLIGRIFAADPSLIESCLIVMRRKFEISMRNVCSCLNDVLGKLRRDAVGFTRTLRLDCEIRPGYVRFKLKINRAGSANKCLLVARIPICQSVSERQNVTAQQDHAVCICGSKLSTKTEESDFFQRCENGDNTNLYDILACIDEEGEKKLLDDACCSKSNRSLVEGDTTISTSQDKAESSNETLRAINDNVSKRAQLSKISCCNCTEENIVEGLSDVMMPRANNSGREKENYCKSIIFDSIEIDHDVEERGRKEILNSRNSIAKNSVESTRLINDTNCQCWLHENFLETNETHEIGYILRNKDSNSFSQTANVNELDDWICSSELNQNEHCNANTCSIASFSQNSELDKQLVELNCNRFSVNNVKAIDKQSEDNSLLNSTRIEVECDSSCSCRYDDFIDITVIDNISKGNIVRTCEAFQNDRDVVEARDTNYFDTVKVLSKNNDFFTASVQTPRLKVSSKGINVDVSCPRSIVWFASGDDRTVSSIAKTRDSRNQTDFSACALIIPRKGSELLDREIFSDRTRGFIKPSDKFCALEGTTSSSILTEEYHCAKNHSTCITSSAFVTSEFTASDRRNKLQKSHKSKKLKSRICECKRSSTDLRNATCVTTIKNRTATRKCRDDDYLVDARARTMLAMTRFRNSVDRSVERIKRLIRAKLGGALFTTRIQAMSTSKTFWENEEFSKDTTTGKISGRCIRQSYSIPSSSTSDCYRRGCIISSRETSNLILSITENHGEKRSEKGMKFRDCRVAAGREALSGFPSIKASSWSYDLLTTTSENLREQKLSGNTRSRYNRKKRNESKRDVISYVRNFPDLTSYGKSVTISSQSVKTSLIKENSETHDDKGICKQMRN